MERKRTKKKYIVIPAAALALLGIGTGAVLANDMKSFRAVVTTATGPVFFSWVFGFGSHVSIKAPEDVKGEYARLVLEAAEAIKKTQ